MSKTPELFTSFYQWPNVYNTTVTYRLPLFPPDNKEPYVWELLLMRYNASRIDTRSAPSGVTLDFEVLVQQVIDSIGLTPQNDNVGYFSRFDLQVTKNSGTDAGSNANVLTSPFVEQQFQDARGNGILLAGDFLNVYLTSRCYELGTVPNAFPFLQMSFLWRKKKITSQEKYELRTRLHAAPV